MSLGSSCSEGWDWAKMPSDDNLELELELEKGSCAIVQPDSEIAVSKTKIIICFKSRYSACKMSRF